MEETKKETDKKGNGLQPREMEMGNRERKRKPCKENGRLDLKRRRKEEHRTVTEESRGGFTSKHKQDHVRGPSSDWELIGKKLRREEKLRENRKQHHNRRTDIGVVKEKDLNRGGMKGEWMEQK